MSLAEEIFRYRSLRAKKVSFAGRNLTELPEEIGYLGDTLEELDLSDNKLTTLPNSIGWLRNLKVLNLRHNKLTAASFPSTTPVEITVFPTAIRYVTVVQPDLSNKFYELVTGEGLKGLDSLEDLKLDHNLLADMPADLTFVTSLKSLSASRNLLTAVTGTATLVNLQKLYLSYNKFAAIPVPIASMIELLDLALNNNIITTATSLAPLVKLQKLNLSKNQIAGVLPTWISSLVEIRSINFDNNLLTSIPAVLLSPLTKVESLRVNGNPIINPVASIPIDGDARISDRLETLAYRGRNIRPRRAT